MVGTEVWSGFHQKEILQKWPGSLLPGPGGRVRPFVSEGQQGSPPKPAALRGLGWQPCPPVPLPVLGHGPGSCPYVKTYAGQRDPGQSPFSQNLGQNWGRVPCSHANLASQASSDCVPVDSVGASGFMALSVALSVAGSASRTEEE